MRSFYAAIAAIDDAAVAAVHALSASCGIMNMNCEKPLRINDGVDLKRDA